MTKHNIKYSTLKKLIKRGMTRDRILRKDFSNFDFAYLDFRNSDFSDSDFRNSNFINSDFINSNFNGSKFNGSDFRYTIFNIIPRGEFFAYKKCRDNIIVKLKIPKNARRSNGATRKCRADKAEVVKIYSKGKQDYAVSKHDPDFIYRVGDKIKIDNFDKNRLNECSAGIHFFLTIKEAIEYNY